MTLFVALAAVFAVIFLLIWRSHALRARRAEYIRHYVLPKGLYAKLTTRHPALTRKECELVAQGLRQFFLCYLMSGRQHVSMPSQIADDLWHEFILYTKNYDHFCRQAFGKFLHHTPAAVLSGGQATSNAGLRRAWTWACRDENIDPKAATRLPLLFALDGKLGVANGFHYVPDCSGVARSGESGGGGSVHCGGSFSDSGVDGSTAGFCDDGGGSSSDGGDGGGGCGGGD
jgi:hypothetical protein